MRGIPRVLPVMAFKPLVCRCKIAPRRYISTSESLPRVAQPSFWHSLIPKFLRERKKPANHVQAPRLKEWNPATFYIVIFLLIGSNAIQMIALRNDFLRFSRKADAKIGLLKEVLERVHRGEDVDVRGLLGTGNEEQEREWEEVLREIEEDERLFEPRAEKKARKAKEAEEALSNSTSITRGSPDALLWKALESAENTEEKKIAAGENTDSASKTTQSRPREFY